MQSIADHFERRTGADGTIVTMRLPESGPAAAASPDTATGAGTAERTASSAAGGSLPQLTA